MLTPFTGILNFDGLIIPLEQRPLIIAGRSGCSGLCASRKTR